MLFNEAAGDELVCEVTAIGPFWIMPYTEWAVWCTAIKIMIRTAKKRALILAVGGGLNCAPKVGHNKFKHERIKVSN